MIMYVSVNGWQTFFVKNKIAQKKKKLGDKNVRAKCKFSTSFSTLNIVSTTFVTIEASKKLFFNTNGVCSRNKFQHHFCTDSAKNKHLICFWIFKWF